MKISNSMINYYLGDVTFGWFNRHDVLPDDVADYHDYVMEYRRALKNMEILNTSGLRSNIF